MVAKAAAVADVIERCLAEFDAVRIWQQLSVRWPAVDEQKLPRDECTNCSRAHVRGAELPGFRGAPFDMMFPHLGRRYYRYST